MYNLLLPIELLSQPISTILLVFSLFFYFLIRWKTNLNNIKQFPPQPSNSWPFLGHLPILGNLPHITFGNLADQYGPIFMIKLGVNRAIVVSTGAVAKECLATNDKAFATRPYSLASKHLAYNSAMLGLSPYGDYWRQMRKITTVELLSNHRISSLKDIRISEIKSALKVVYNHREKPIDMKEWFVDLSVNSIVRLVSGKSLKECYQGEEYIRVSNAFRSFFELAGAFVLADALPFVKWLDVGGYERKMKKVAKEIDGVAQKWLEEHRLRKGCGEKEGKKDFMDVLLDLFEAGQDNLFGFDADTTIKANCMTNILAGSDTTGATLTWALSLLLNNKEALQKTKAELYSVVGKERLVEESDIKNLVYLQAVLKETMRLYPASVLSVPREAITDCIVSGYRIPSGTRLFVNLYKMHRDPQVWEDPLRFHPERFLTTHKEYDVRGQNYEFIPFGSGRRICPGISFALQVMQFTLANLLHRFDFTVPSNGLVDMSESFGLTNVKATPLEVIVTQCLRDHLYDDLTTSSVSK